MSGCDRTVNNIHLTYAQIEELWINAGGKKNYAPLMAAIAFAESGGRAGVNNTCDNNGTQTSWGLWQISNGTHSWPGGQDPNIPENNAKYAVQKFNGQGLDAWGTYTSGAYRQYLRGNVPPGTGKIPKGGGGSGGPPQTATLDKITVSNSGSGESLWGDVGGLAKDAFGWITGIPVGGASANPLTSIADVLGALAKAVGVIADVFAAFMWLMNPTNELRLLSGVAGIVVLGIALYFVATA